MENYLSLYRKLKQKSFQELKMLQGVLVEEKEELGLRPGSEGFILVNDSSLNLKKIVIEDLLEKKK